MKNTIQSILGSSLLACALLGLSITPSYAQFEDIGDFLRTGRQDAETLTRAYLSPYGKGIGSAFNTGWFNTASTHGTLGFDIQVRGALAIIPDGDQTYNFNDLSLTNNVELAPGQSPLAPTAGGDNSSGPEVVVNDDDGNEVGRFNLPAGSGFHYAPAPMIQASVGAIRDTDVILRYVPKVNVNEYGSYRMAGFGFKHSLNQWIPAGQFLPVNLSVLAGYNRINMDANLDVQPNQPDPTTNYDNQQVETTINTFTIKVLASKDLPFLSVYAGAGYETSRFNLDVVGNYPVSVEVAPGVDRTVSIEDPFSYSQNGANTMSVTGGLKFKLAFFNLFADYTFAQYHVANAGIGFSFR